MSSKDSAKTIVCYGDSNTWGRIPSGGRYPRSVRWTNVLQKLLGDEYEVISEGLAGRTLVAVDPKNVYRTGITHLKSILETHVPVDVVIVFLGTNDVKSGYNLTAEEIADHLDQTIAVIQQNGIQKILIISPPKIVMPEGSELRSDFVNRLDVIASLAPLYKEVAEKYSCGFLNAQDYITSSKVDGFHLDVEMHAKLAEVVKDALIRMDI